MKEEQQPQFALLMAKLSVAYQKELIPELVELYWTHLKLYSLDSMQLAVNYAINESSFFPKVSELRKYIHEYGRVYESRRIEAPKEQVCPPEVAKKWIREIEKALDKPIIKTI